MGTQDMTRQPASLLDSLIAPTASAHRLVMVPAIRMTSRASRWPSTTPEATNRKNHALVSLHRVYF